MALAEMFTTMVVLVDAGVTRRLTFWHRYYEQGI